MSQTTAHTQLLILDTSPLQTLHRGEALGLIDAVEPTVEKMNKLGD